MGTRQRGQVLTNSDGSYSIRYYLPTGRRKQEGTFRTKTDAARRLRDVLREIDAGTFRDEITFGAFVSRWFDSYEAAPSTRSRVEGQLRLALAEFEHQQIRKITPEQVAAWRLTISDGQRHQTHGVLRQVMEAAVRWGYLGANPARLVRNPSPKREAVAFLRDWSQAEDVAAEIGEEYGRIVIFAAGTGLRPSEWIALDRRDVDLAAGVLRVERSWTDRGGLVAYGKTDASRRSVPIRARVAEVLRDAPRRGLIFPAPRGGHLSLHNWRARFWTPAVEAAGVGRIVPYAMRHTYAAWSLAAGIGVFALARRMGTSVEMIDRTYGHLVHDAAATEAARLDEWDAR